jgi:hypothetical protein
LYVDPQDSNLKIAPLGAYVPESDWHAVQRIVKSFPAEIRRASHIEQCQYLRGHLYGLQQAPADEAAAVSAEATSPVAAREGQHAEAFQEVAESSQLLSALSDALTPPKRESHVVRTLELTPVNLYGILGENRVVGDFQKPVLGRAGMDSLHLAYDARSNTVLDMQVAESL